MPTTNFWVIVRSNKSTYFNSGLKLTNFIATLLIIGLVIAYRTGIIKTLQTRFLLPELNTMGFNRSNSFNF